MKRFIVLVGQNHEFINKIADEMKSLSAVSDVLSGYSVLYENIQEIFKKKLSKDWFKEKEEFNPPIQITEHDVRAFYSKIGNGVFAVSNFAGATLKTPQELLDFFEKKVGAKAYGEYWIQSALLERMHALNASVYLVKDVNNDIAESIKIVFGKRVAIVQVVNSDEEDSLDIADIKTSAELEDIKQETINILSKLKEKWSNNDKPTTAGSIV